MVSLVIFVDFCNTLLLALSKMPIGKLAFTSHLIYMAALVIHLLNFVTYHCHVCLFLLLDNGPSGLIYSLFHYLNLY